MNCYEIKQNMGKYIDQELVNDEMLKITHHLKNCPNCLNEMNSLKQIESLLQREIYQEPPKEYWSILPTIITQKLGLRPQSTIIEKCVNFVSEIKVASSIRWGLVGAATLVSLLFLYKEGYRTNSFNPPISQQNVEKESLPSVKTDSQSDATKQNLTKFFTEKKEKTAFDSELTIQNSVPGQPLSNAKNKDKLGRTVALSDLSEAVIAKKSHIKPVPVRLHARTVSNFQQEIFPIPNSEFILSAKNLAESEKNDVNIPEWSTYSLNSNVKSPQVTMLPKESAELDNIKNSFSETLWIVQESRSLSEKRNIWLSYISRESDPTYRSLGIYNLALVLSKIAEQKKDPENAQEALDFFTENEKSLRFQMGNNRYQIKIDIFKKIIFNK
ncbi:MAG: anti-sigma factor family protein [bacterium]